MDTLGLLLPRVSSPCEGFPRGFGRVQALHSGATYTLPIRTMHREAVMGTHTCVGMCQLVSEGPLGPSSMVIYVWNEHLSNYFRNELD